jgi:hypothetical protein
MADNYRVGVSIALANGISPVLAIIGRDMLGLQTSIRQIERNFRGWAGAIAGVGSVLAGGAIIGGLAKIAEHGEKLLDQQVQLKNLGIEQNDILKIQKDYYNNIAKAVPTSTASEYLKTVKELRAVTGSTEDAARLAPKALKVDALLSNVFGTESHGEYYKLLRSEEMKGISTDEKKREAFTDEAFKYIMAFGGKLTARDYQTLAKRGGAAFMGMKPEAMGPMSVFAADVGGETAGTTMMTFNQLMTGAQTLSKQQGKVWEDLGLLNMDKVTKTGFGASRLQLGVGAFKGSQEHSGDLPGYIKDVIWPAIEKASGGNAAVREELISKLAPNRNANRMIHMFGDAGFDDQIRKDMGIADKVLPIPEAYDNFSKNNPKGVKKAFGDQYDSMMEAIGAPVMQAAIPIMRAVTDMFTSIGSFANAHPEAIKTIAYGLGALAAALIAIPVAAVAVWAGIPASLLAIVGALGTLAAVNFSALRDGLMSINDAITRFIQFLVSIPGELNKFFGTKQPNFREHPDLKHNESLRSFNPGGGQAKVTPISLSLNVDGRTLAQTMSQQFEYLYEHATGAPSYDGRSKYIPADGGVIGG